ncbi:MAG: redoxin domain-containing protein [Pedobacter sp.]|nr:MAG: redoxin domain-containing protein [Pedobacter sp.]
MKTYLSIFILLFSLTAKAQDSPVKWATQETFFQDLVGNDLPDFKGLKTNGKMFSKTSLNNQVVVINFWFENCPPCIAEMPELNKFISLKRLKYFSPFLR